MRRPLLISLILLAIVLCGLLFVSRREGVEPVVERDRDKNLPSNYSLDTYTVAEKSDVVCKRDRECELPMSYAVRSSCPYAAICLEGRCAVVCPGVKR